LPQKAQKDTRVYYYGDEKAGRVARDVCGRIEPRYFPVVSIRKNRYSTTFSSFFSNLKKFCAFCGQKFPFPIFTITLCSTRSRASVEVKQLRPK
jgi:hypothetical protein